jgi:hypothetical protein|tara:strand:- start:39 stop:419 length:381 start_codon:yes stop_codon:yes gene_type:complete
MAHYAKVNNGIVEKVIVAEADFFNSFVDDSPGAWIQTSYNTIGGIHYERNDDGTLGDASTNQSKALRKNYAGVGFLHDSDADAFYEPKPFNSWTLNTTTYLWEAPVAYPSSGTHIWNESDQAWDAV